jgi:hypothetical protein
MKTKLLIGAVVLLAGVVRAESDTNCPPIGSLGRLACHYGFLEIRLGRDISESKNVKRTGADGDCATWTYSPSGTNGLASLFDVVFCDTYKGRVETIAASVKDAKKTAIFFRAVQLAYGDPNVQDSPRFTKEWESPLCHIELTMSSDGTSCTLWMTDHAVNDERKQADEDRARDFAGQF